MERWNNKVAVVTGASTGIGAAIAVDLVKAGCVVVGLARRAQKIEELRENLPKNLQLNLHAFKCDVSNLESVGEAFDWIIKTLGGVDILVNNAGIAKFAQLLTPKPNELEEVLQTNVMGVIYCTQRAVKSMKDRNFAGHIVIINSVCGHQVFCPPEEQGGMMFNIYPASKYALRAINEVLRHELRKDSEIKVTSISPGAVDTEIVPEAAKSLVKFKLNAEDISNAVLYVLGTPPHVQVHEMIIKPLGEVF